MIIVKDAPVLVKASRGRAASETTKLSIMDQVVSRFPLVLMYAFKAPADRSSADEPYYTPPKMQHALSKVLNSYPFLCGTMTYPVNKDSNKLEMVVQHTNHGALFISACCSSTTTLSACFPQDADVLNLSNLSHDLMPSPLAPFLDNHASPLLEVQMTTLECGGVILGLKSHHGLLDGESGFRFVADLGRCYRGLQVEELCHDRGLLSDLRERVEVKFNHAEYDLPVKKPSATSSGIMGNWTPPPMSARVIRFPTPFLKSLKSTLSPPSSNDSYISTKDALTAFLTTCITTSRSRFNLLTTPPDSYIGINTGINGRNRLSPPLPARYTANAIWNAYSSHPVSDLTTPTIEGMSKVAQRIRAAVSNMTDEYLRDAIHVISKESGGDPRNVGLAAKYYLGKDVLMTSWAGMGLYEADFGSGRAVYAGPPRLEGDGILVMLDSRAEGAGEVGGLEVCVCLVEGVMRVFEGVCEEMNALILQQ
ncbi:hypothetical protein HDV05_008712 [Chytridiales sp. JEL 0842]|nr:hypothetical protein HDV05_008712 [Chytridiales sp. JEL 0842]